MLTEVKDVLLQSKKLVVFTGAGVSAESGIPTFRDALTGHWAKHDINQLANATAFINNPGFVYSWYEMRRKQINSVQPNTAHEVISYLETIVPEFTLVTQNVDDLHERSGSTNVLHLHGSIHKPRCFSCSEPYEFTVTDNIKTDLIKSPPHCLKCGDYIRPGIVWFSERLPEDVLNKAEQSVNHCDVMLIIGTSGVVYPAAKLPFDAKQSGAKIIQINPTPTDFDMIADFNLVGRAAEILGEMFQTELHL